MWMKGLTSMGMYRLILMWLFVGVTRLPATSGLARETRQTGDDGTILNRLSNLESSIIRELLKTTSLEKELSEIKSRLDDSLIREQQQQLQLEKLEIQDTEAEQKCNANYKRVIEKTNRLENKIIDLKKTCLTCSQSGPTIVQTSPPPSTVRGVQFSGKPLNDNDTRIAINCRHLTELGYTRNGVYRVEITRYNPVLLFCIPLRGYMRVQWGDDLIDFNKTWEEYKYGFGNYDSGWWIGNEIVWQALNSSLGNNAFLRIFDDNSYEAYLHDVQISDETEGYKLHYSRSTVQPKFRQDQVPAKGSIFMTRDSQSRGGNCPDINVGWWYQKGQSCNSNSSSINFQWVYLYLPL